MPNKQIVKNLKRIIQIVNTYDKTAINPKALWGLKQKVANEEFTIQHLIEIVRITILDAFEKDLKYDLKRRKKVCGY